MKILNGICLVAMSVALLVPMSGMAQDTRSYLASDIPEGYMPEGYDENGNYTGNSGSNYANITNENIQRYEAIKKEAEENAADEDELIAMHQEAVVGKQQALEQANANLAAAHEANRANSTPETLEALAAAKTAQRQAEVDLAQAEADLVEVSHAAESERASAAAAQESIVREQVNNSATMGSLEEMEAIQQASQATQTARQRAAEANQAAQDAHNNVAATQARTADQYQGMFGGLNLSDLVDNNYGNYKEMLGDTLVK